MNERRDESTVFVIGEIFQSHKETDLTSLFVLTEKLGPEVLAAIRELSLQGDDQIVVVLHSGGDREMELMAIEAGAEDCISSPDVSKLIYGLESALARRHRQIVPLAKEAPVFRLDTSNYSLQLDGRTVHLSPLEYRLLLELRHHEGHVVSYDALETVLWGQTDGSSRQCLKQLARRLRKRLADHGQVIACVPGVGYSLRLELLNGHRRPAEGRLVALP